MGPWLVALLSLILLAGCDTGAPTTGDQHEQPWPQAAVVADLSQAMDQPPAASTLADLKAVGFDTVLLDARSTPRPMLQRWIETAKTQQLRTVVAIGSPGAVLPGRPDEDPVLVDGIAGADGISLTLRHASDLDDASDLRDLFADHGRRTALIATVSTSGPAAQQLADASLFDVVFTDYVAEEDRPLHGKTTSPPSATFSEISLQQAANGTGGHGLPQWQRVLHCQSSKDPQCAPDARLLVMGLMRPTVPVTGVLDGTYWRDVLGSLIRLRREHPLIRTGERHWFASDAADGVMAYRISNERGQHVIVAINVSDGHHELPLPSGFMAVSKVRIWASHDPRLRELVTSKPVVLPARSAVIVIEN